MSFCSNCGKEISEKGGLCAECKATAQKPKNDKLTNLKEKARKAVQSSQEFIQSEQFRDTVEVLKENVSSAAGTVKEKAQQAAQASQEFVQSEQFKEKTEKVKETISNAANTVKEDIENSNLKKRTGLFAKVKNYKIAIAAVIVVFAGIGFFVNLGGDSIENNSTSNAPVNMSNNSNSIQYSSNDIIGTWAKATGVLYTFREDGHISISLAKSYDKSKGSASDGLEVTSLLQEIDRYGRVTRGGTWEYIKEDNGCSVYNLFTSGMEHTCTVLNDGRLRISLAGGMAEPSYLTKVK